MVRVIAKTTDVAEAGRIFRAEQIRHMFDFSEGVVSTKIEKCVGSASAWVIVVFPRNVPGADTSCVNCGCQHEGEPCRFSPG